MPNKIIWTEEQLEEAKKLYSQGYSLKEIGKYFDCSSQVVSRIFKENNVAIRTTGRHKYFEKEYLGPANTLFKKRLSNGKGLFKCSYCGKDFITEISSVGKGLTKSCGCLHSKTSKKKTFIDITGQRFGKLVAKYEVGSTKDGRSIWYCECDCGGHKEVVGKLLRNGHTHSCGCSNSKGNVKVKQCLEQLQLSFEEEKTFEDCYTFKGYPYYFDFYLPDYNCCIEYDGKQHYVGWPIDNKRASVEYIQKNDQIKTDYCKNNNIKLIRIPYTEFDNITPNYINNLLEEL